MKDDPAYNKFRQTSDEVPGDGELDPAQLQDAEEEEEMEMVVDLVRTPLAQLPSIDDEAPPLQVDYRDWSAAATKVVSGPIGPVKQYPGRRFISERLARAYWAARAGRIIEDLSISGRYIYRVRRDA